MSDVFILGAGFSKAIHSGMPTLTELSSEVIARLRRSNFPIPDPLDDLDDNIELWITYLSQRQPWLTEFENDFNKSLTGRIREEIGKFIEERIAQATLSLAPEWLNALIKAWHREQATVITLNYDTLVERASRELRISEKIERILSVHMYPPYFTDIVARRGEAKWGEEDLETFSLTSVPTLDRRTVVTL